MRAFAAAAAFLLLGLTAAQGQNLPNVITPASPASPDSNDSAIAVPPAPAIIAAPPGIQAAPVPAMPATPGLVQAAPPANIDTGGLAAAGQIQPTGTLPAQGQAGAPDVPDQDIAPIPPNTWLPAQTAKIGVLDKIDGSVAELSIPVGGQSVVGDLNVSVQACLTRPPDQAPDAAVFLALQNAEDSSAPPNYRGWVVRSAPGAAVAGDASETFRVIDCD